MVLVLASKLTWLGGRNSRDFSVRGRNWLDFIVGIRNDLVLCGGRKWLGLESASKLTWFSCRRTCKIDLFYSGDRNWLDFSVGVETNLVCVWDRNWLDFIVRTEVDLFFCGSQIWPCFCVRVEKYLFLVWAWKLTWFLWYWSKLTRSQCGGSNLNWFQCRDKVNLIVVWVVKIDLLLLCWPNITCF